MGILTFLVNLKLLKFNFVLLILLSICLFATIKYHIRFNENRKFHELNYVDFDLSSEAKEIDKKFKGLKWITPQYKNKSKEEISLINEVKLYFLNDKRSKMVITKYSFFSTILDEKVFSPSRWYVSDGSAYPLKSNKYFVSYKNLFLNTIKKNNIKVIYTIYPQKNSHI